MLFSNLKIFSEYFNHITTNKLKDKLIEIYEKQLIALNYDKTFGIIEPLNTLKLDELSATIGNINYNSLKNIMKSTNNYMYKYFQILIL